MDIISVDFTVEDIEEELFGRIVRDFGRLTKERFQPPTVVLSRFEVLFQRAIETLGEHTRRTTTNDPVRQRIGHTCATFPPPGHQHLSTAYQYEYGGFPSWSTVEPPYSRGNSRWSTDPHRPGESLILQASVQEVSAPAQVKRVKAPKALMEGKWMDQATSITTRAVTIHDKLSESLIENPTRVSLLTFLSVDFACPRAVSDFIKLLPAICGYTHLWLPSFPVSTSSLMSSIDQIEADARANAIRRRICLAQLRQQYSWKISQLEITPACSGKPSSNAIEAMTDDWMKSLQLSFGNSSPAMKEDYRTRLKNRLSAARLWYRIFTDYSFGGLALFSTDIPTTTLEVLPEKEIEELMTTFGPRNDFLVGICQAASRAWERYPTSSLFLQDSNIYSTSDHIEYDSQDLVSLVYSVDMDAQLHNGFEIEQYM